MTIGLDDVVAAETALSHVDGEAGRLIIAGHDLEELAGRVAFEDVVAMLWRGPRAGLRIPRAAHLTACRPRAGGGHAAAAGEPARRGGGSSRPGGRGGGRRGRHGGAGRPGPRAGRARFTAGPRSRHPAQNVGRMTCAGIGLHGF